MNARVGMVTVWVPFAFLPELRDVKPAQRVRKAINARIAEVAKEVGVEARFDPRAGKDSRRLDAGRNYGSQLRGRTVEGSVIVCALALGNFYVRFVETREAGGQERKLEICQHSQEKPSDETGILSTELYELLLERLGEDPLTIRGFWLNQGREDFWTNIVVSPGESGTSTDLRFSHDGQQVVVEIPETLALPAKGSQASSATGPMTTEQMIEVINAARPGDRLQLTFADRTFNGDLCGRLYFILAMFPPIGNALEMSEMAQATLKAVADSGRWEGYRLYRPVVLEGFDPKGFIARTLGRDLLERIEKIG